MLAHGGSECRGVEVGRDERLVSYGARWASVTGEALRDRDGAPLGGEQDENGEGVP